MPDAASTRTPRTGRRPGSSGTRDAIQEAACRLFRERGYDATTIRAIAAEAEVDPALVMHFFGSKARMFVSAVEWPIDPESHLAGVLTRGPEHVGEELARLFVGKWEDERDRSPVLALLRSAMSEPSAAALLREFMVSEFFVPVAAALGQDDGERRGALVSSQLIGLGIVRYVLRVEPLASDDPERVIAAVAPTLQRYLTGPLSSP
jgi:AcrR family transcriptional regulator